MTPNRAQARPQPAPQEDRSANDRDDAEIVITAQKREERVLDIPQSVTVVSGDTLERQQANTFAEYLNEIPRPQPRAERARRRPPRASRSQHRRRQLDRQRLYR